MELLFVFFVVSAGSCIIVLRQSTGQPISDNDLHLINIEFVYEIWCVAFPLYMCMFALHLLTSILVDNQLMDGFANAAKNWLLELKILGSFVWFLKMKLNWFSVFCTQPVWCRICLYMYLLQWANRTGHTSWHVGFFSHLSRAVDSCLRRHHARSASSHVHRLPHAGISHYS